MTRRTRRWGAGLAAVALLTGCARGKEDARLGESLAPQFPPDRAQSTTTTTTDAAAAAGGEGDGGRATSTSARVDGPAAPGPAAGGAATSSFGDPVGDLTPSPLDPPPPWADLAGASLTRGADGYELRVKLGGGSAPSTTDEDHTMNVASFYDVDGDGRIDFEVWANLASGGWGSSYFDNRPGRRGGGFQDRSGVTVTVRGDEVVLAFPLSHLGGAERFRWALASEWGRYDVLGTPAMARDDAPDNDAAARFPS